MKRSKPGSDLASSGTQDFDYVDDQEAFEVLVDKLISEKKIAIDTEFHRERTYYPSVALVQIAHSGGISLIDPLKIDLEKLTELLNSEVLIVMHAASQDLEVFQHVCGAAPKRLFDKIGRASCRERV